MDIVILRSFWVIVLGLVGVFDRFDDVRLMDFGFCR